MKKENKVFGKDVKNEVKKVVLKKDLKLYNSKKTIISQNNKENKENNSYNSIRLFSKNLNESLTKNRPRRNPIDFYLNNIITHLQRTNGRNLTMTDPFKYQTEINKRMRGILINWLLEVHSKFNLKMRTMFLACNILDRFLEFKQIPKTKLQLIGICGFLIASKYEDIYPPEINDFCYLCENIFTKKQIIDCEGEILSFLNFNLIFVSPVDVSDYFLKVYNNECENLEKMTLLILEMFLFHADSGRFDAFKLGAFAMNFANLIINFKEIKTFQNFISTSETELFIQELKSITSVLKIDQLTGLESKYKGLYLKLIYSSYLFN